MGDDFSNRQCYVGDRVIVATRLRIQQTILDALTSSGYSEVASEAEATRSLVVGPAGGWVFVGDTTGSTEDSDPTAFVALSLALSKVLPVIDVHMSDTAAVHIHLYKAGALVDKYGNAAFPFFKFKTEAEAAEFKGHPELWAEYLIAPYTADDLRKVWVQDWGADAILSNTAKLFGWDLGLAFVGYTLDDEGLGIKYDEYLRLETPEGFTELHFRK
jgi:hypothetical protein